MKLWDTMLNRRLQARLRQAFAAEAQAAEAIDDDAVQRVWERIDARLPRPRQARQRPLSWALVSGLAVASLGAVVLQGRWAPPGILIDGPGDGHLGSGPDRTATEKGGGDLTGKGGGDLTGELTGLRFAAVGSDRSVVAGHDGMQLKAGTPLIFSVESQGVSEARPLAVVLSYVRLDEHGKADDAVDVASLTLTQARESLMQGHDFLAFTPHDVGTYQFYLRPSAPKSRSSSADPVADARDPRHVGFHVQITAP